MAADAARACGSREGCRCRCGMQGGGAGADVACKVQGGLQMQLGLAEAWKDVGATSECKGGGSWCCCCMQGAGVAVDAAGACGSREG